MKLSESPVTQHQFGELTFFLKRDDQLHSHFSGNKARKFMSLLSLHNPKITTLVAYGSAQANSLYTLAALARIKGWQLDFYVDHLPNWLRERPIGNYRGALDLGANIIALNQDESGERIHPRDYIEQNQLANETTVVVPEGGRFREAEEGVQQLAREILSWSRFQPMKHLTVALPSGTGVTALYLHKHLKPHGIEVITCPCVGGKDYLIKQFEELGEDDFPQVLELNYKHHFGKLYHDDYLIWQSLLEKTSIEFDLLYDPMMWQCLVDWRKEHPEKTILYVHQGGILATRVCCKVRTKIWSNWCKPTLLGKE